MRTRIALAVAGVLAAWAAPAAAQTLDDLVSQGTIRVGVNLDAPPYGSVDAAGVPQGFDVDVARLLGRYLGVRVEIVQTQGPTRIPLLLTKKIDLIVADLGITPARAKQVMFSRPYGTIDGYIIGPKERAMASAAELKGTRIGVPRASTFDVAVTALVGTTARIMRFDDDATTFQALLSGQVDAVGENSSSFAQLLKLHPDLPFERKIMIGHQLDGVGVRRGQFDVLQWLDTTIEYVSGNGELDTLYRKWLDEPLPASVKVQ